MKKPKLVRQMEIVASRVFKRTRGVQIRFESQMEQILLMSTTYGDADVLADFEEWAVTASAQGVQYPITEYLNVVDARLGTVVEPKPDNPEVTKIMTVVYQYIKDFPRKSSVEKLIEKYGFENLREAWLEYADGLSEDELKHAIKKFFEDGGVDVVYADMMKFQKEK